MAIAVFCAVPNSSEEAHADMGPKPSVNITFENLSDELCYGTLLSQKKSTGPSTAWEEEGYENIPTDFTREIWQAFVEYEDTDGYYFLQVGWQCNEKKSMKWGYYPPGYFKILLYYPKSNTFVVSGIYDCYAFDSYYTVNMDGIDIGSVEKNEQIVAKKSYNYLYETLALVARIAITILLEIGIALLFRFREKKLLRIIGITNIVTQILLNVGLNIIRFYDGILIFYIFYILFEIIVFAIEATVYAITFKRAETKISAWKSTLYAFVANLISFGAGILIVIISQAIIK
jgi:hypothetical protein